MTPLFDANALDRADALSRHSEFVAKSLTDLVSDLAQCVRHYRQEYVAMRDRWNKAHPPEAWVDELMVLQIRHQLSHAHGTRRRLDVSA